MIGVEMWKSKELMSSHLKFFNQIKKGLERLGIKSYILKRKYENIRKDGIVTKAIGLRIKNLKSIIIFSNKIGFNDIEKQEKLNKIIKMKSPDGAVTML